MVDLAAPRPSGLDPALSVRNVRKTFRIHTDKASSIKGFLAGGGRNRSREFTALDDVSFDVEVGEAVGIIGHNGSGKSTLLKCMAKILTPNEGEVLVTKRMAALLELGAGFHPELTGRDNVFLNASILGMPRREIEQRFDDIVDFSGLHEFIDAPVKTYSSGMYVRLGFAVAINVDPELLLIDEVLAVGDITFQQKCMEKFVEYRDEGRTLVLVTHDSGSVRHFCDRAIWLDHGKVMADGQPAEVIDEYNEKMLGGEAAGDGSGGIRRGSGEITVERVELLVDGQPAAAVRSGGDLVVRMNFTTTERVPNPVFAIRLSSLVGVEVTAPSTRDVDQVAEYVEGSGWVDVRFSNLPLVPGPYVVHTEVTGYGRKHIYDHIQNAQSFDVVAGNTPETEGLVTMRPSWSIEGTGVGPPLRHP
ncbi:MAG: ABC transporter ATP-binding protein [Actinomycetota bacterium]